MPRKIKVVDIQPVEEPVFETAQEEDVKDDYLDTKEEAAKETAFKWSRFEEELNRSKQSKKLI